MKYVLEIHAAEGGEDSKLFVKDLAQAYLKLSFHKG
jgi:protein subunit release factor A